VGGLRVDELDASDCSSARHKVKDQYDDGENQKDVNPSTQRVAADESYNPEDEKDNRDCPKHFVLLDDCRLGFPDRSDVLCSAGCYVC
jgi:hypothetical protein